MKKIILMTAMILGTIWGCTWECPIDYGPKVQAISYDEAFRLYDDTTMPYPKHLWNNEKIVLAYVQMGQGCYVDLTSLVCQIYDPPIYRLAANVIWYDKNKDTYRYPGTVYYQYDTEKGYIYGVKDGIVNFNLPMWTGKYHDLASQRFLAKAKLMWKAAYGTDWQY